MRPWLVGVLVAVGTFALVVVASYAFIGFSSERTPSPPCPSGWTPTHDERECARNSEVCNSFMNGASDETVACSVASPDGSGWLRVNVQGNGGVSLSVRDASNNVIYSRTVAFSEGLLPDISVKGRVGTWKLTTEYHAQGSAQIILWG